MIRNAIAAALVALALAGCANLQAVQGVYTTVTETTVPATVVIPTANAFNILKLGATNYGRYCIANKMPEPVCSAGNRRIVIKAVRAGTGARRQMVASVEQGQPALSSIYNVLVAAVNDLQKSPVASAQFVEPSK
jgi:hypothetical protein